MSDLKEKPKEDDRFSWKEGDLEILEGGDPSSEDDGEGEEDVEEIDEADAPKPTKVIHIYE